MAFMDVSQVHAWSADLRKAGRDIERRASQVVRKTTLDIQRDAKIFVPVDTGFLMGSITVSFSNNGLVGEVGPTAFYGVYVEFGTSTQGPQAYMRPATDRHEELFIRAMGQLGLEVIRS